MVLSPEERDCVEEIVYEDELITTDLKPSTLANKIELVRPRLCKVANNGEIRNYEEISEGYSLVHWSRVGTVLGVIGLLEYEFGNPLLPAVVVNEKRGWPGDGFVGLLDLVGEQIPESESEQKALWRRHLEQVYSHDW